MESQPPIGKITVAPTVLETIARLTTLAVPGVVRMMSQGFLGQDGVKLEIDGNRVRVDLFVMTKPDANMLSLGRKIQMEVTRAIQDMVGMEVEAINVHIEDVARSTN